MKKFLKFAQSAAQSATLRAALRVALSLAVSVSSAFAHDFSVSAPGGAPGLVLAAVAKENPESCTFVAAETIAAEFARSRADFIIAPVNAGAKLFKAGKSTYRLAAVVTWGNLYFASQRKKFKIKDIKKTGVTMFGENTINASVALAALEKNGVKPARVEYLAGAANTQALLLSDPEAVVLTAEPALTAARMKNGRISAVSVNGLCRKALGFDGYAQAGLFVRAETAERNPSGVMAFLADVRRSAGLCSSDVQAAASLAAEMEILPSEKVAAAAIPNCAIRYVGAKEARAKVEATAGIDIKQYGGALPADGFYYDGAE